jgi:hypothetical protein
MLCSALGVIRSGSTSCAAPPVLWFALECCWGQCTLSSGLWLVV